MADGGPRVVRGAGGELRMAGRGWQVVWVVRMVDGTGVGSAGGTRTERWFAV